MLASRKPNRLASHDYMSGGYFITVCTRDKRNMFWADTVGADSIRPPQVPLLSNYGRCVQTAIEGIPRHYPHCDLLKYCIMPNHIHLILLCSDKSETQSVSLPTISTIIGQMKRAASKSAGTPLWQKSFHDRVIRNEKEYLKIWNYIEENPLKWELDCFYSKTDDASIPEHRSGGYYPPLLPVSPVGVHIWTNIWSRRRTRKQNL